MTRQIFWSETSTSGVSDFNSIHGLRWMNAITGRNGGTVTSFFNMFDVLDDFDPDDVTFPMMSVEIDSLAYSSSAGPISNESKYITMNEEERIKTRNTKDRMKLLNPNIEEDVLNRSVKIGGTYGTFLNIAELLLGGLMNNGLMGDKISKKEEKINVSELRIEGDRIDKNFEFGFCSLPIYQVEYRDTMKY